MSKTVEELERELKEAKRRKAEEKGEEFVDSAVIGAITNSAVVGTILGGDPVGAILGDLFNGGSLDE